MSYGDLICNTGLSSIGAVMNAQDFPLAQEGEVDLVALDRQVDWDNPTALERVVFSVDEPDYAKLNTEVAACPRMAHLRWSGGKTLLHLAAGDTQNELARLLIRFGANVNADYSGYGTPIHEAIEAGNTEGMSLLVEHGARVDTPDNSGRRPLHKVARYGDPAMVDILLRNGAEINQVDADGQTPLDLAITWRRDAVVKMLIEHGAKVTSGHYDDYVAELMRGH